LVAIGATTGVLFARMALSDHLDEQARLLPFVLGVMAAAWMGGLRPGLVATALGVFLGLQFIVPPHNSWKVERLADGLNAVIFVFVGIAISLLFEALHAARRGEGERQFRTLADYVAQLVWIARPDGYRYWFNQRWYEYTGTTLADGQGSGWQTVCDPADVPHLQASWQVALEARSVWEETYRLRRQDGSMRWFLARAVPMKDDAGEITQWFGTSTDIHDRIEIEQALHDADLRKDHYLATLAHELRNPLAPISNALQLWPNVADDPVEMEELRVIMLRQVKHLIRLVDDLLDVARISQGKIVLQPHTIDLRQVVEESLEAIRPLAASAGHRLTVQLADEPIFVSGDSARLLQVFLNILSNAVKYTPRGGELQVSLAGDQDQAVVRIRDNGAGIPAEMLATIFEPFYQVARTIDSAQGGLGIGLTLAAQLVKLHGGEIVAASDGPGCGSEFVVKLPALAAASSEADEAVAAREGRLPRLRIVVVDDSRDCADTLAKLLRTYEQEVTALHDGPSAIDWILRQRPDVVLLDIAMPGMDGYEVARRLREHVELDATVLIALTGYGQPDDRRHALTGGFNHHLTKPVKWSSLEVLLRQTSERLVATTAMQ
jgi:PAS domain S-box-containing protein